MEVENQTTMKLLEETLAALDALAEDFDGEAVEDLEDLNAELEDALMLLDALNDDEAEERCEALSDICALAGDYRALASAVPGLDALAIRLENAARGLPFGR